MGHSAISVSENPSEKRTNHCIFELRLKCSKLLTNKQSSPQQKRIHRFLIPRERTLKIIYQAPIYRLWQPPVKLSVPTGVLHHIDY